MHDDFGGYFDGESWAGVGCAFEHNEVKPVPCVAKKDLHGRAAGGWYSWTTSTGAARVSTPIALTMPEKSEKRLERFLTNSAEAHKPEYILRMFEAIKGRKATFEEVASVTRKFTPRPRKRKQSSGSSA